jgi:hypothetical protein
MKIKPLLIQQWLLCNQLIKILAFYILWSSNLPCLHPTHEIIRYRNLREPILKIPHFNTLQFISTCSYLMWCIFVHCRSQCLCNLISITFKVVCCWKLQFLLMLRKCLLKADLLMHSFCKCLLMLCHQLSWHFNWSVSCKNGGNMHFLCHFFSSGNRLCDDPLQIWVYWIYV